MIFAINHEGIYIMKAIQIHQYGGPEVLTYGEAPLPQPGPGQARVKIAA